MPRVKRLDLKGQIYHVLNRANARLSVFDQQIDYDEYLEVLSEGLKKYKIDLFAYIVMPNHWHLVISPRKDKEMSKFMQWVTMTHTQRWHARRGTIGTGHFYQGRYKSFLVKDDRYFIQVCKYVEANALRSGRVKKAERWIWSSLYQRRNGIKFIKLSTWPIARRRDYLKDINNMQPMEEINVIRKSVVKQKPFGDLFWLLKVTKKYNLCSTLKEKGRPKSKFF